LSWQAKLAELEARLVDLERQGPLTSIRKTVSGVASLVVAGATDGVTIDTGGAGSTIREKPGGTGYASLAASALPKQGIRVTSTFTTTSASLVNVTNCEVVTNGPAIVICSVQVIVAGSTTISGLAVTISTGTVGGIWIGEVETLTIGDVTSFGTAFSPATAPSANGPNMTTAGTYDLLFVGYVTAAATVDLQAKSDGTRTFTVAVGSAIASSI
jgi:hypothetical protein